jgi:ankyrin repeat protein
VQRSSREILHPISWKFDEDFGDVLHLAKTPAIAKLLLDYGADANIRISSGKTPLHMAVEKGHVALAEVLLNYGANVSATSQEQLDQFNFL